MKDDVAFAERSAGVRAAKAIEITPGLAAMAVELGKRFCAAPHLHECDHILAYITRYSSLSRPDWPEGGLYEYFANGRRDAEQIKSLMARLGITSSHRILEFASGYGRVTRHLKDLDLTSCDIHSEAVEFLMDKLGVKAFASALDPDELRITQEFDFIFVLSLFSHLTDELFGRWLSALTRILRPGGYLMFTTHGESAGRKVKALGDVLDPDSGYGFIPETDQPDLPANAYGASIVMPSYILSQVFRHTDARVCSFSAAAWWTLQDEWVLARG